MGEGEQSSVPTSNGKMHEMKARAGAGLSLWLLPLLLPLLLCLLLRRVCAAHRMCCHRRRLQPQQQLLVGKVICRQLRSGGESWPAVKGHKQTYSLDTSKKGQVNQRRCSAVCGTSRTGSRSSGRARAVRRYSPASR